MQNQTRVKNHNCYQNSPIYPEIPEQNQYPDETGCTLDDSEFIPHKESTYDWAKYKRIERQNSARDSKNLAFKTMLDEMTCSEKKFVLIKNNLIDMSIVKTNFSSLGINEFQAKIFHFITNDREWSEAELKLYSQFWRRDIAFMKQLAENRLPRLHRSSYKQIRNKQRLMNILDFLLSNSVPAAQRKKDLIALKQSLVIDETLRSFYRYVRMNFVFLHDFNQ